MSIRLCRLMLVTTAALGFALAALPASAQTGYPNKVVRIVVPFGPGGASDLLPRLLATPLSAMWGQQVVIDNRPGAAGNIGMEFGARAAPDGYTLTSGPVGNLAINRVDPADGLGLGWGDGSYDPRHFTGFNGFTRVSSVSNPSNYGPGTQWRMQLDADL